MSLTEHSVPHPSGGTVHYWQAGDPSQRPLLLIHGDYGNAYTQWSEVMASLSEEYFVVAPDLPGYGQSSSISPLRLDHLVTWVKQFIRLMEFDAVVIVGSAYGALVARMLTSSDPALIPALILINGGIEPDIAPLARALAGIPGVGGFLFNRIVASMTTRTQLEGLFVNEAVLKPPVTAAIHANRKPLAALMRGITLSSVPTLANPPVPVLLLWGENDALVPIRVGEHLQANMPGSELARIENCGHLPQIELPDVVASQIHLFLKRMARSGRPKGAGMLSLH